MITPSDIILEADRNESHLSLMGLRSPPPVLTTIPENISTTKASHSDVVAAQSKAVF
jgi:hypothetical protein